MPAKIYKDPNPKYIELYSRKPPNIAPKIFADKACDVELIFKISFENAIPEKRIGKVSNNGYIRLSIPTNRLENVT